MSDFLHTVARHLRSHRLGNVDLDDLRERALATPVPSPFLNSFTTGEINIIAEVKYASPSQGVIVNERREDRHPEQVAMGYCAAGARGISVLTEPKWFQGDTRYLQQIRNTLPQANLLMKDFVIAEEQVYTARLLGANAVLLIVAMLPLKTLVSLHALALDLGLTPLVEVHNAPELCRALEVRPRLLGINNRNLKTLKIDLKTGIQLRQLVPGSIPCVCESGIESPKDLARMFREGFDTFLIGTSLMRSGTPGEALKTLLDETRKELGQ